MVRTTGKRAVAPIFVLVIGLAALLLVLGVVAAGGLGGLTNPKVDENGIPKHNVRCDVVVSNPLLKDLEIESFSCERGEQCGSLGLDIGAFGIFSDSGKVQMRMGDESRTDSIKVDEGGSSTASMSVCSADMTGTLYVRDSNSAIIDTKTFEV